MSQVAVVSRKRHRIAEDEEDELDLDSQPSQSTAPPSKRTKITATQTVEPDEEALAVADQQLLSGIAKSVGRKVIGRRPGSIVRMRLVNVMTYAEAEIFPGPQLNVVLGPNGTGKSSIVCGMVLGFGGKPAFLGRGKDISDFIRKGTDKATIEIEVYVGEGKKNLKIQRDMRKDNTSTWKLNDKAVSAAVIKEAVERMNVQVENLCSFLPQDRVSSFSELDAAQLLRETELAIDGEDLVKKHDDLIQLKKDQNHLTLTKSEAEKDISNQQQQNQAVERDVIRFQQREQMLKQIADLNKKRPWLEFEAKRLEAQEHNKRLQEARRDLKRAEERIKPLKDRLEEQRKIATTCEMELAKIREATKVADSTRTRIAAQLDEIVEKTDIELEKRDGLDRAEREREKAVEAAKAKIEKAKQAHADAIQAAKQAEAKTAELTRAQERLRNELSDLSLQVNEANRQRDNLRNQLAQSEANLKQFDSSHDQRLNQLQGREQDVFRAYQWVTKTMKENKFRGPVYGPMALEINVPNKVEAKMLENAMPDWLRLAFVVEFDDDARYIHTFREQQKWQGITVVTIDRAKLDSYDDRHQYSHAELKQFQLEKYLDEVFDTPASPLLKKLIVSQSKLNMIPFRSTDGSESWDYRSLPFNMFFSKSKIYTTTESRYGNRERSTLVRVTREPRYLMGIDQQARARAAREVEERKAEYENAVASARRFDPENQEKSRQLSEVRKELEDIKLSSKRVTIAESTVKRFEDDLKRVQQQDVARERDRITNTIKKLDEDRFKLTFKLEESVRKVISEALKQDLLVIRRAGARRLVNELELILARFQNEFQDLTHRVTAMEAELNRMKAVCRQLKDKAEEAAPLEENREMFEKLPKSIEEIDAEIDQLQARATSIVPNPELVRRYEERKAKIESLQRKLEAATRRLDEISTKKEKLKNEWLPRVQEITQSIGRKFEEFFENMGCRGAIRLHEAEEEDFAKYGIEIQVAYRANEPLQQLAASRQSGGEKSVATMLYLVSLQQLSDCPFRLVDEINQGMDPKNERMIFEQVTRQASLPNTPQYFLITPKLLPDLFFQPNCTVLTVLNGPWETEQRVFNASLEATFGPTNPSQKK